MKTVCSISGGGLNGQVALAAIERIEALCNAPLSHLFDLIAGTSTGAIAAAVSASPIRRHYAADIAAMYVEDGPEIFGAGFLRKIYSGGGAWHTKYRNHRLKSRLRDRIGTAPMGRAATSLMFVSFEADRHDPAFIKSWESPWREMPLWEAAAASASAPVYFPSLKTADGRFIDGGIFANDPSVYALAEAIVLWPGEDITLVSFGTGRPAPPLKPLPDGGAAFWAPLVHDVSSSGQEKANAYALNALSSALGDRLTYFRVQPEFPDKPGMDDTSTEAIRAREAAADAWLSANMNSVLEIAAALTVRKHE